MATSKTQLSQATDLRLNLTRVLNFHESYDEEIKLITFCSEEEADAWISQIQRSGFWNVKKKRTQPNTRGGRKARAVSELQVSRVRIQNHLLQQNGVELITKVPVWP